MAPTSQPPSPSAEARSWDYRWGASPARGDCHAFAHGHHHLRRGLHGLAPLDAVLGTQPGRCTHHGWGMAPGVPVRTSQTWHPSLAGQPSPLEFHSPPSDVLGQPRPASGRLPPHGPGDDGPANQRLPLQDLSRSRRAQPDGLSPGPRPQGRGTALPRSPGPRHRRGSKIRWHRVRAWTSWEVCVCGLHLHH